MKDKQILEDLRLEEISNALIQYSLGNFEQQIQMSDQGDGLDAIIAGVNMLGEELKYVTVSRDSLSRVYNSISEMLFVTNLHGEIEDVNEASIAKLGVSRFNLLNRNIFEFIKLGSKSKNELWPENLHLIRDKVAADGSLLAAPITRLRCTFSTLRDTHNNVAGILIIAEDVTDKLAMEKRVIRAIIDTQEKERNRFASDLHDSLGQQLSGIRFYISALHGALEKSKGVEEHYQKTLRSIDNAAIELRDICFNLMPRTLENHTLNFSLHELASKFSKSDVLELKIHFAEDVPKLSKEFEIASFRIVQEFLNNAMKHGSASKVIVQIKVSDDEKSLEISLTDDGRGFDTKSETNQSGMGLRNINTRVDTYYGKLDITSRLKHGVQMHMKFPLAFVTLP